jgi:hypothetical protein
MAGSIFSDGIVLHILVEQFIRVQFRAIAGKKKYKFICGIDTHNVAP